MPAITAPRFGNRSEEWTSFARIEPLAHGLESAVKQTRHGGLGRAELIGDFSERPSLEVMHLDRAALGFGERPERLGHSQYFLLANRMLAGRRLFSGEPSFQAQGRLVQCRVE